MSLTIKPRIIDGMELEDFMIGSDPELRFEGTKARSVLPFEGDFGCDGPNSPIGELRSKPSFCPINHIVDLENVMRGGYKKYVKLQNRAWLAGSMQEGNPLGGHIHFGSDCDSYLELKLTALDKLLAPVVLMLEKESSAKDRRHNTEYGRLATHKLNLDEVHRGYKTKYNSKKPLNHGGYEYRPLSSWLVSKNIATGVLALAKVIAFQAHNKKLHRHLWVQLKFIGLNNKFYDSYYDCNKKFFAPTIPTIYRIVRSFKLFPAYEKQINYLFHLISQGRDWNDLADLKKRWNIIPEIKQTKTSKMTFSADSILSGDILSLKVPQKKIYLIGEE